MLTSAIMLISQINNRSAPPCCFVIKVSQLLSVKAQLNCNIAPSSEIPAIWQNYLSSKAFDATSSKQIGMGWSPKKVARAGPNISPGEFRLVKLTQKFHTRGGRGGEGGSSHLLLMQCDKNLSLGISEYMCIILIFCFAFRFVEILIKLPGQRW